MIHDIKKKVMINEWRTKFTDSKQSWKITNVHGSKKTATWLTCTCAISVFFCFFLPTKIGKQMTSQSGQFVRSSNSAAINSSSWHDLKNHLRTLSINISSHLPGLTFLVAKIERPINALKTKFRPNRSKQRTERRRHAIILAFASHLHLERILTHGNFSKLQNIYYYLIIYECHDHLINYGM